MRARLCTLCVVALSGGALLAGCGGSSNTSSSSSAPASAPATPTTPSSTGGGTGAAAASIASNPAVQQAVAACKQSINASPTLSAGVKSKLVGVCDQAATGNPTAIRKATSQVCQEVVKSSVPSSAQAAALATCPKS
jgi:hypothetical protein